MLVVRLRITKGERLIRRFVPSNEAREKSCNEIKERARNNSG